MSLQKIIENDVFKLDRARPVGVSPHDYGNVISFNSTYLEIVDGSYQGRGLAEPLYLITMGIGPLFIGFIVFGICSVLYKSTNGSGFNPSAIAPVLSALLTAYLIIKKFPKQYLITHRPIRFNRVNRKVYLFNPAGGAVSFHWDDLAFYLKPSQMPFPAKGTVWTITAAWPAENARPNKALFSLPCAHNRLEVPASFFEFVRLYMEKGPATLKAPAWCLPIDKEKENAALNMLKSQPVGGHFADGFYPSPADDAPMFFEPGPDMLSRRLINKVSKIPLWPGWVDMECRIEPDDQLPADASKQPPSSLEAALKIMNDDYRFISNLKIRPEGLDLLRIKEIATRPEKLG